jgi:hypothetical protein
MPKKANIFDSFSHSAIQQFKEAFGIMDVVSITTILRFQDIYENRVSTFKRKTNGEGVSYRN